MNYSTFELRHSNKAENEKMQSFYLLTKTSAL